MVVMKHVVLFSGGAASSYVAYLLTQDKEIDKKRHSPITHSNIERV